MEDCWSADLALLALSSVGYECGAFNEAKVIGNTGKKVRLE